MTDDQPDADSEAEAGAEAAEELTPCGVCGGELGETANPFCRTCAEYRRDECVKLLISRQYRKSKGLLAIFDTERPYLASLFILVLLLAGGFGLATMKPKLVKPPPKVDLGDAAFASQPSRLALDSVETCGHQRARPCKGSDICVIAYGKVECKECEGVRRTMSTFAAALSKVPQHRETFGFAVVVDDSIEGAEKAKEEFKDGCFVDPKWSLFRLAGLRKLPVMLKVDKSGHIHRRVVVDEVLASAKPEDEKIAQLFRVLEITPY